VEVGSNLWMRPLSEKINSFVINNPNFAGFVAKIYNKDFRLIQYQNIVVNKNAKRFASTFHSDPFDPSGPSYADFFYGDLCKDIDISGTVVDAGANVGFFTLYSKHFGARKIYSIDPDPLAFFYLEKNFGQDASITLLNKGMNVSDVGMDINISLGASVGTSEFLNIENYVKIHVPTTCVDSILSMEDDINLLKLDIEGTEFKVIENLNQKHFDRINQFFIEFHFDPKPIAKKLIDNGYKVQYRHCTENDTVGFIYATKL
jgi:FkbM family methyltransferase